MKQSWLLSILLTAGLPSHYTSLTVRSYCTKLRLLSTAIMSDGVRGNPPHHSDARGEEGVIFTRTVYPTATTRLLAGPTNIEGECNRVQTISDSLLCYGIVGNSDPAVLAIVSNMIDFVEISPGDFTAEEICLALYSLQGLTSHCSTVRKLLSVLTIAVDSSRWEFNAAEFGNAFYGLRRMSSDSPEVLNLIASLGRLLISCQPVFDTSSLLVSFDGLRGIRGSSSAATVMDYLYSQIEALITDASEIEKISTNDLSCLSEQLALNLSELYEAFNDEHPRWEGANLCIVDEMERRNSLGQFHTRTHDLTLHGSDQICYISISSNYNVLHGVGHLLAVKYQDTTSDMPTISHGSERVDFKSAEISSIRFCMSRDKHLGVQPTGCEAVGAKKFRTMDHLDFENWLINRVSLVSDHR